MGRPSKPQGRGRGQIIPKGPGKYLVRVYVGSENGKRKYSSKMIHGTISEARKALSSDIAATDQGTFVPPARQTVAEYLRDWLENTAKVKVSTQTYLGYKQKLTYPIDKLGSVRLDKLHPQQIQKFYTDLVVEQQLCPTTVRGIHVVLNMALEKAVAWKVVAANPTEHAERPRVERVEAEHYDRKQVDLFLETAKEDEYYAMWLLFTATGLRPQEMFALQWADLGHGDEIGHYISVQRALVHVGKGKYEVGPVKTKKGRRLVSIPQGVVDVLNTHRRQQAAQILKLGERYQRNGLMFASDIGTTLDVNNVRKRFNKLCRKSNLPEYSTYALRHTHATLLLLAGVALKIVSERLGHASITITADTYSHVTPEMSQNTAATVEALLFKTA